MFMYNEEVLNLKQSKIINNFIYFILIIFIILTGCNKNNQPEKIEYQILFQGFAALNEFNQPSGATECLVFTSEEDWIDFCNKYFGSFPSVIMEVNNREIDFQSENLVFVYSLGPKHSYDSFINIKYLLKEDKGLTVEFDNKKETKDTIYVLNNEASKDSLTKHAVVFLLSVKFENVPEDSTNLYMKE